MKMILALMLLACDWMGYGGQLPIANQPYVVLCKSEIAIGYSLDKKTALFVAQKIDPEKVTLPNASSSPSFKQDPSVDSNHQASLKDYAGSGYDRGHLAAFEDNNHTLQAAAESSYLTNIIPQNASMNRGIWRVLEGKVREESLNGSLYVISGPIYSANSKTIGDNIKIPDKMFKVIVNPKTKTVTTYIIPNAPIKSDLLPSFISNRAELFRESGVDPTPIVHLTDAQ
jgi:endonuclease G, mitochondrial